ncbi:MAG: DUF1343 domain-containing protein [Planctomycetes bacterium]|nr:DUF1343 domain-containing protein [Planctomycetota bacterium]
MRSASFLAALVLLASAASLEAQVRPGIDRPELWRAALRGRRVGVVANHTAVDARGQHLIDLLAAEKSLELRAIFGPEHGIRGDKDEELAGGKDERTGLPVHSLYGKLRKPTPEMLGGIDTLVFDIQDVGARFYTYISTLSNCLEAAAELRLRVVVLDRPNPLGGAIVEGPLLEKELRSFVGCQPIPVRHGMSIGELARMFLGESWIKDGARVELVVIPVEGWQREQMWPALRLPFVRTSPNMPSFETALAYPGLCLLEGTNLNEGRGTDHAFLRFGAPWIDAEALRLELGPVPGLVLTPIEYTPVAIVDRAAKPRFQDQKCRGLELRITEPEIFRPVHFGARLIAAVQRRHPEHFKIDAERLAKLLGTQGGVVHLQRGEPCDLSSGLELYEQMRTRYFLYPPRPEPTSR